MSSTTLRIAVAQLNLLVGDIPGNTERIIASAVTARDQQQADLIVFPELTLTGYPPEDLLLRPSLKKRVGQAIQQLFSVPGITMVVGAPLHTEQGLSNAALVIRDGAILATYVKQELPNHAVFDERRYFEPGHEAVVFEYQGLLVGLTICEDIWHEGPARAAAKAGADLLINLNASPFNADKVSARRATVAARCQENNVPVLYCNLVGGQDELVFDGGSFALQADAELAWQAPFFNEQIETISFDIQQQRFMPAPVATLPSMHEAVYNALVLAVRDYVNKSGFKGVVLGLSGGIDSALTLAIAVDALGADRVRAVMMPYRYTAQISLDDAEEEAKRLGVHYSVLAIEPMVNAFSATLAETFAGLPVDKTEENLQSRSRGVLLMAISNKLGYMVLTTGNKSEMAVGYATLYGDMAGGFDVLKDVAKVLVFDLCRWRNEQSPDLPPIPQRVIDRPPSAELAPDQKDEDSLPPYPVLDEILRRYIELDESAETIVAAGFDNDTVHRVLRMVDINEYKRRQSAIGPRVTRRGFGKDRRYPIVNGWKIGH
ncbi:MAG: NAD+ synthase [Acinetobacter sp.]|nr:NAD+ synthase [Acinetobacter sp.]